MEPSELLHFLVGVLERLQLQYFVTGSTVTIFYGEPRFTNDIDVVVALPESIVTTFCRQFPEEDFYVDEHAVRDAIRHRSQFNIIHPRSGLKIDVMIPQTNDFNRSRFERVRRVSAGGDWDALFASPEDAIIKKMEEYIANGLQLGWLIDPDNQTVYIYRPGAAPEMLKDPATLSGDPVLPGFVFSTAAIW